MAIHPRRTWGLAALAAVSLAAGCSSGTPTAPTVPASAPPSTAPAADATALPTVPETPATSDQATEAPVVAPTDAATTQSAPAAEQARPAPSPTELLGAPVPSACGHPAGTLENGRLPGIPQQEGYVAISTDSSGVVTPTLEDALPDGTPVTFATLTCSQGGVEWPEIIVAYAAGPTLVGYVDLAEVAFPGIEGAEHAGVDSWDVRDVGLGMTLKTYDGAGSNIYTWQGFLDYENGGLVLNDLMQVSGPENPM